MKNLLALALLFLATSSALSFNLRGQMPSLVSEDIRTKVFSNILVALKDANETEGASRPQDPCNSVYSAALEACRVATSGEDRSEDNLLCVNWALASHVKCYDSCLVDKLQCTLETRENARVLHAILSTCKPEVCTAFQRAAIDISSKFEICFDSTPSCEDPQIIAFNFYRFGDHNFDLATQSVEEVLHSLEHLRNATAESTEALYNCSDDANCIFAHSSYRAAGEQHRNYRQNATNNATNATAPADAAPADPNAAPAAAADPNAAPANNETAPAAPASLLEVAKPVPESFLQVTVRFIRSLFA
eukprot:TRINITY_DN47_c0_g1_i3.p1 TRINITY_DN47_c0_g1~~TRINITY_DN47_c0_g1_i3.p1  ORF type:complete len:304 (+),score=88.78 TRINITY_DN47_c0_g1_i3:136-1047(+)